MENSTDTKLDKPQQSMNRGRNSWDKACRWNMEDTERNTIKQ